VAKSQDSRGRPFPLGEKIFYVKAPPFFDGVGGAPTPLKDISGARVLAVLGDSVTTDIFRPAGSIAADGPAANI